jgi:hypothetical protein
VRPACRRAGVAMSKKNVERTNKNGTFREPERNTRHH